ncbi:MAG: hypothetical protein ACPIA1_04720 [Flavobacteriaceae bacterium]
MKKIVLLFAVFSITLSQAQNTFSVFHIKAKPGGERAIGALFDDHFGDAKFKSGGVQLERVWIGDNEYTHRIVFFGELGKLGRVEGDTEKFEGSLFWERVDEYVEEWGISSSGRFLSYAGETPADFPFIQIYDIKVANPAAFKAAHDKIVKQMGKIMGERPVAFGTYDIGGNGASHWVVVGSLDWEDAMQQKVAIEKKQEEWAAYFKNRGPVEDKGNFSINVIKSYGSL